MVRLAHLEDTASRLMQESQEQLRARPTAVERAHARSVWTVTHGLSELMADPVVRAFLETHYKECCVSCTADAN
jgi:hypothetical protein